MNFIHIFAFLSRAKTAKNMNKIQVLRLERA